MPSGEGPLPTKTEMLIERQSSALPCREAAQFNNGIEPTAGRSGFLRAVSGGFDFTVSFVCPGRPAVAHPGR